MISIPVLAEETDAATLLGVPAGELLLARWEPGRVPAGRYEIWPDIAPFAPGRGFWIRLFDDVSVNLSGIVPDETASYAVPIKLGWNMIGSPRLVPVTVDQLQVEVGTQAPVSFSQAVTNGWVQEGIYGYDQQSGYVLGETLQPFAGYWMRCLASGGARLIFPPM